MITQETISYIKQQLALKVEEEEIKNALRSVGWQENDIDEAFRTVKGVSMTPTSNSVSPVSTNIEYAGFWRRVAAVFIDQFVVYISVIVFVIVIFFVDGVVLSDSGVKLGWLGKVLGFLFPLGLFLYFPLMESSKKQATLGKMVLGIAVTDMTGNRISFWRALGRMLAKGLSVLTLGIGLVMAGFTEKKQTLHDMVTKCLVVKRGESSFWKVFFISLFVFSVIIASMGAYGYFIVWPKLKQSVSTVITVAIEPTQISEIEPLPEKTVSLPELPISLTEDEYDEILSQPLVGFKDGVSVGPAVLKLSNFWEGESPKIWVEVMLPFIPNFQFDKRFTKIVIDSARDKKGNNIYNNESDFEYGFFQRFSVSKRSNPISHLSGIRSVQLLPGVVENDIASITGKLILQLPLNIKELSFLKAEGTTELPSYQLKDKIDINNKVDDVVISVNAIENSQVLWTYKGDGSNYIDLKAYNEAGEELDSANGTSFPSVGTVYENTIDLKALFKGDIASVKLFIASKITERVYPFVLTK